MRVPNSVHQKHAWRIHEIVPDFTLEDVWALPIHGDQDDFQILLEKMASFDPSDVDSLAARMLWRARDLLGRWLDLGGISGPVDGDTDDASGALPIPGTDEYSLAERLPEDLRGTTGDLDFSSVPFTPLYRTEDEFAAEISNRTVHGVLHVAWAEESEGRYEGQMAVYVKPRGLFGQGYMAFIKPFRYLIVYPALMRRMRRMWEARAS